MESGEKPELNAQRYAVLSSPEGTLQKTTATGIILGRLFCKCCESGNFGTRPSYEGKSQLLGIAQVRFPGRKK